MTSPRRSLAGGSLLFVLAFLVFCSQPLHAIPAFARKYGLPCSACHEAWPKLNSFGQKFKDEGYQLGNEKDAPIYQQPGYGRSQCESRRIGILKAQAARR